MKIQKIKNFKHKLLKLKLIKTKLYKKNYYETIKTEEILFRLKKACYIISKYHTNKKTIMLIGTSNTNLNKKLNKIIKKTNHFFVPKSNWVNGILTNQNVYLKALSENKKASNKILRQKKSDLIIILDESQNQNPLSEAHLTHMPSISLNVNFIRPNEKAVYKIPGNFKFINKKFRNNFFYSLLKAIFKNKPKNPLIEKYKDLLSFLRDGIDF